ncbi:hypothetical protein MSG28_000240 [Choristoneura fumiferana]|uniref:Uncharacterized protein n=1 Tax=Choristoneura fumiferana TaxID=7141 RepID=A0ACC0K0D9_CHOFU|nr:hypothetical protein MSG28_000240 [Choristoneura fumiferana]
MELGPGQHSQPASRDKSHLNCHEFSRGVKFEDHQAVGSWTLLRLKTENTNSIDNSHCVDFVPVNDKERKELEDLIGMYVENLEWKNLTLKMQIPCAKANSNRSVSYFLERLDGDGSYRTLQMPQSTAKLDLAAFHRYPVKLKLLEGRYLGMHDCLDRVSFLMGRQPEADDRLKNVVEAFWPEEA